MIKSLLSKSKRSRNSLRRWTLKDAQTQFGELARMALHEGPQHVIIDGRDEVVVLDAAELGRLRGDATGAALISVMQACPCKDFDFGSGRGVMPVRDVV